MRDVETPLGRIKTLVIEAVGARHRNIRDLLERGGFCIIGGGTRKVRSRQAQC